MCLESCDNLNIKRTQTEGIEKMKQGTTLIAKTTFGFKNQGKGRTIVFKEGQKFWVTTTELFLKKMGYHNIDRYGKGCISHGYAFDLETINTWFEVV